MVDDVDKGLDAGLDEGLVDLTRGAHFAILSIPARMRRLNTNTINANANAKTGTRLGEEGREGDEGRESGGREDR